MNRSLCLYVLICAICAVAPLPELNAAGPAGGFVTLPAQLDGTMMPYDFGRADSGILPDSLHPSGVVYIARHGARFPSSTKTVSTLRHKLDGQRLSSAGQRLVDILDMVDSIVGDRWGQLSPVGIDEEKRLGREMQKRFPGLFARSQVRGAATYVPRTIMTMFEFMHSMEIPEQSMRLYAVAGSQNDSILRFFETYAPYREYRTDRGAWKPIYDRYVETHVPASPARRLFEISPYDDSGLRDITLKMYSLLSSLRAMGLPGPTTELMSLEEYRACYEASNLSHYLRNTVSRVNVDAARAVLPLLRRIIADGDSIVAISDNRSYPVRFYGYYAHAETLMPLFSALNLPGCMCITDNFSRLTEYWQDQNVVPLGANLEIDLLRGPSGTIYAALRLNGRYIMSSASIMITPWKDLADAWWRLFSK